MSDEKKNQEKTQPVNEKTPAKPMVFGQWNGEPYNREEVKAILWQEWH